MIGEEGGTRRALCGGDGTSKWSSTMETEGLTPTHEVAKTSAASSTEAIPIHTHTAGCNGIRPPWPVESASPSLESASGLEPEECSLEFQGDGAASSSGMRYICPEGEAWGGSGREGGSKERKRGGFGERERVGLSPER